MAQANPYHQFHRDCVEAAKAWHLQLPPDLQWLSNERTLGLNEFERTSLPTRRTENWKYTPVTPITQGDFLRLREQGGLTAGEEATEQPEYPADKSTLKGLTGEFHHLSFTNGHLSCQDDYGDSAVEIIPFSTEKTEHRELIRQHLNKAFSENKHPFATLNSGVLQDGVMIRIKADSRPARPICINHLNHGFDETSSSHVRVLIVAEPGSVGTVIENFSAQGQHATMSNALSEVFLSDNSKLEHLVINGENSAHIHTGAVFVEQQSGSQLIQHSFATGSRLKRRDIQIKLLGPLADCKLFGSYLIDEKSHVDFHTCLDHIAPHCTSEETFKGIVTDQGKAVFNGRIHIHPDAQKSNARMNNKNLLLTNTAEVNTKPELEIYADDVKCAHGATVGQLDDSALYYCQTRGIAKDEANKLLSHAFIDVNIKEIHIDAVKQHTQTLTKTFLEKETDVL